MFIYKLIISLFTLTKTWSQPKCPLTNEWIRKMWSVYARAYHAVIKKGRNSAVCNSLGGS
uniref:Uncharacterized protein n=1 Tax=Canis lupus dingo TaxID=286419 RepID=A0A8C0KPP6_CANLU